LHLRREEIKEKLEGHQPARIEDQEFKPAAVLMTLFKKSQRPEGQKEWHVLFTLRSPDLPTHKNQISFPGGQVDQGETALQAALREAREEVGIRTHDVEVLGRLDDIITITRFRITPFVGAIPYPYEFQVSEDEITELIKIPLENFLDHNIIRRDTSWQYQGRPYPVYYFHVGEHVVWGATARILKQFLELVLDWKEPEWT
jgi:8-oxo-dGTP pyrophosphatase MutT (NUDIX family)